MTLLDDHQALRMATLARHAAFSPTDETEGRVRALLGKLHGQGEVRALEEGGEVRAVLAWRHDPEPWFGTPVTTMAFDQALDADAAGWLARELTALRPRLEADLDLLIDASHREAARALLAEGLCLDSVQLLGDVETALARLGDARLPEGLRLWPLSSSHLPAVIALHRETFGASPEHCWFGAAPRYLEMMHAKLSDEIDARETVQRVLLDASGRVLGHLSASVDLESPFFGPSAGMSLALAPEARGQGTLRAIYRHLLGAARERGARSFKGGTSQPAVMHLARVMERSLVGWHLRLAGTFPPAHFGPYAP